MEDIVRLLVGFEVVDQLLGGTGSGCTVTVVIDDGVAEQTIEPRDDALFVANVCSFFDAADESRLQNVFRGGFGIHSRAKEREELPAALYQACQCLWREPRELLRLSVHPMEGYHACQARKRRLFATTLADESAMAAPAIMGVNWRCNSG